MRMRRGGRAPGGRSNTTYEHTRPADAGVELSCEVSRSTTGRGPRSAGLVELYRMSAPLRDATDMRQPTPTATADTSRTRRRRARVPCARRCTFVYGGVHRA